MILIFIVKAILLAAALKLYSVKKEPLYSALLYSLPLMLIAIFNGTNILQAIVNGGILLTLSFIFFWLQSTIPKGNPTYSLIGVGAILFLFVL